MTRRGLALIAACIGLTGCAALEDHALGNRCKALIEDSLVSPASAQFLRTEVYRRIETNWRDPKDGPSRVQIDEMRAMLPSEREVADIDAAMQSRDLFEIQEGRRRNREYMEALSEYRRVLSEHIEKRTALWKIPHGEVHWELDTQNRAGAIVRIAAVCTFVDDGNQDTLNSTFELSSFGEGRIPEEAPKPFGATPQE